jgi:flagellar basal-body rod protein FlgG
MIRGIYSSAGGMITEMYKTENIANDLANVDTAGYKRTVTTAQEYPFHEYFRIKDHLEQINTIPINMPASVGNMGTGVMVNNSSIIFEQGRFEKTEAPLDVALDGPGFFILTKPEKSSSSTKEVFSRNGNFNIDKDGYIINSSGYRLMGYSQASEPSSGRSIYRGDNKLQNNLVSLQARGAGQINITLEGIVYQGNDEIGQIALAEPADKNNMRKEGLGHYTNTAKKMNFSSAASIKQGYLEKSNVNPVKAMVELISVQRAFETGQKLITSQDETLGKLFTTVN